LNAVTYANTTIVSPELGVERTDIVLNVDADYLPAEHHELTEVLPTLINDLDDQPECEVSVTVKVGFAGTGTEATFKVKGDCEEIMDIISRKISQLRGLIRK
jgi:hypothetical protein